MNFYNRLEHEESQEYGERIRILVDLQDHSFELVYREDKNGFHRTVTCFGEKGNIQTVQSSRQEMVGEFSKENIENHFEHFISEEWTNYT